ncbi:MAG TPA: hypothetical protein VLV45_12820 [Gemmatimonadales bacterium]|nr:hypothetical protein [Gemmatimonadales bacterium]
MAPRARERILSNLETVYREAYDRAKETGDERRMHDLDSAYQREQLLLEVLLDIRDALTAPAPEPTRQPGTSALATLETLRRVSKLR